MKIRSAVAVALALLTMLGSLAFAPAAHADGITTTFVQCRSVRFQLWDTECRFNTIDWGGAGEEPTVTYGEWVPQFDVLDPLQ